MENAVDALKIAFAVMFFTMALSLTMYMFTQARTTADAVLHSSDVTALMSYEEAVTGRESRVVGLETIIPTLYKYYKENYTVIFREKSGAYMQIYETKTNTDLWSQNFGNQYYGGKSTKICSFDVDEETRRHEPWTGSTDSYKKNLDAFLSGGTFDFPSGSGESYNYENFIERYKSKKFLENLGEYVYNKDTAESAKEMKKRVIIYTLQ